MNGQYVGKDSSGNPSGIDTVIIIGEKPFTMLRKALIPFPFELDAHLAVADTELGETQAAVSRLKNGRFKSS